MDMSLKLKIGEGKDQLNVKIGLILKSNDKLYKAKNIESLRDAQEYAKKI